MSDIILTEQTTPTTPATGKWAIYCKTDGLYYLDDTGTETGPLDVAGSGGTLAGLTDVDLTGLAQGNILYYNGTDWVVLAPGTNGYFLKTQGAAANPIWAAITGGGDLLSTNNLSDVANAATARSNLGLAIGTNVQAYDADLAYLASFTPSANVKSILNAADYAAIKTLLGVAAASGIASLNASTKVVEDPANATATPTASKIVIADAGGKVDGWITAATESAAGKVELATAAEINTGTDATRAVSPDALAGSIHGKRVIQLVISDASTTPSATGDGKAHCLITSEFNGMNIVAVAGLVTTASSSGTPTFAIRRERSGSAVDVLSTNITIDTTEKTSLTAATAPVINTSNDDLATGDILYADLDLVGTGAKGHLVAISVQLP